MQLYFGKVIHTHILKSLFYIADIVSNAKSVQRTGDFYEQVYKFDLLEETNAS